jgi:hypothetical protein
VVTRHCQLWLGGEGEGYVLTLWKLELNWCAKSKYVNIKIVSSENGVGVREIISLVWVVVSILGSLEGGVGSRALDCSLINAKNETIFHYTLLYWQHLV